MRNRFLFLSILLLLFGCADEQTGKLKEMFTENNGAERIVPVGIMAIDSVGGIVRNTYPGSLEEGQSVDLAFKYGGTLDQLNVREGSQVSKGQVLARVSSPSMESTLRSAQATLEQAQDAYDRLKKVHDNGSLPEIKWKEMEANLQKAQAAYDLAQSMMEETVLKAPINGTVSAVGAELGESITPMKPIIKLINMDGMSVKISVPESEIQHIRIGEVADIVIPALGDRHYSGKVLEKGLTASLLTHSYPVKVKIQQPTRDLFPGMIGKVVLHGDVAKGIVIPANAILINREGRFVWVKADGRATRRTVTVDGYSGQGVIISDGLHYGDSVIVEGYQKISEGMRVTER